MGSVATHSVQTVASRSPKQRPRWMPARLQLGLTGAMVELGSDPVVLGRKHVPVEERALASRKQAVVRAVPGNMFELLSVGKRATHVTRCQCELNDALYL